MRVPVIVASLLIATPAVAQGRDPVAIARALQNPAVQEGATAALGRLTDILLDTRIGAMASLGDAEVRPDDTLRDLKLRDDPEFEARLRDDTRRALRQAGTVAGDLSVSAAELQRTTDRLRAALAPFLATRTEY